MIIRNFKLYLNAGVNIAPVIHASQFDQGEEWIFTLLTEDGTVYTPSTGAIIGLKTDGTTILNAGTVNEDGQVVITETEQMTAVPGSNIFEILIDGNSHGTANFVVFVERRPGDIDHPSESDISLFQEAIEAAGNITQFQTDIANLQSNVDDLETGLSQEESTRSTQDAVLSGRIDTLTTAIGETGETVLFDGRTYGSNLWYAGQTITLSESYKNFDYLDFYVHLLGREEIHRFATDDPVLMLRSSNLIDTSTSSTSTMMYIYETIIKLESQEPYTTVTCYDPVRVDWNGTAASNAQRIYYTNDEDKYPQAMRVIKIVGVKLCATNPEVTDIRVGGDGVTYPTAGDAVRGQYSDLKNAVSNIYETETSDYTSAYTSGSIALNVGVGNTVTPTPSTSTNYLWQIIPCSKGDSFVISGLGGEAPRIWGFTDSSYKLLSVAGPNVTVTDKNLTATEDGYFISNVNKNNSYSLTATLAVPKVDLLNEDLNDLSDKVDVIDNNVIELYQTKTANEIKTSENLIPDDATIYTNSKCEGLTASYVPSVVSGEAYLIDMAVPSNVKKIWCKKFTKTGQMVLIYKANTSGVNYTKSANIDNTLIHNDSEYFVIDCSVAIRRGFERIMISFDSPLTAGIYEYNGILNTEQNLKYLMPLTGMNMFSSVACLGDSYTQGFIVKSDTSATIAKKPYPAVLHDKLGITVDNYGVGGTTSKTYITHADGLPKVLADESHDLYIICFGINDQNRSMTIGTASDINDADYTQNADTFYGNMGKIVQMLKAQFPLARYTIIGNFATGLWYSAYNPYNVASKGIAEHFNIPYVNPMDDPYFYSDIYITDVGGHPTQPGYTGMAYAIERLMNKCIADNFEYFKYAGIEEA